MRTGATISGVAHGAFILVALFGVDWFTDREDRPLNVTEIEFVDGTEFEARLSTAPFVPTEDPKELTRPGEGDPAPDAPGGPDEKAAAADAQPLADAPEPDASPDRPEIAFNTPTNVPTEAPRPSIAVIPSPDALPNQSAEPESKPSTEPVQPLASNAPSPEASPSPPPQPQPEPEPERTAEVTEPDKAAEEPAKPDPEERPEASTEATAESQPDAPRADKPQEARLPVAKPADRAAAALAARREEERIAREVAEKEVEKRAEAEKEKEKPEPEKPATRSEEKTAEAKPKTGGSTPNRGPKLNRGEINALRVGIKQYYSFTGDRSDKTMRVSVRVGLTEQGEIATGPDTVDGSGGNDAARRALGQAGRRAIIRAAQAGEFKRLPVEKYGRWQTITFIFTIDQLQVSG